MTRALQQSRSVHPQFIGVVRPERHKRMADEPPDFETRWPHRVDTIIIMSRYSAGDLRSRSEWCCAQFGPVEQHWTFRWVDKFVVGSSKSLPMRVPFLTFFFRDDTSAAFFKVRWC
jgi:hypothetical protein